VARIAIFGATGKLGQRLTSRALERGFRVNVVARDPRKMTIQNQDLTLLGGEPDQGKGIDAAIAGCAFVVSAIGSALSPVVDRCMEHLVPALEQHKLLKRFVFVSRLGTGESRGQSRLVSGPLQPALPLLLMPVFRDINLAEARVRASKLPYTILRPTRLTDDPATGKVVAVGAHDKPPHRITRADLTEFILDLCDAQNPQLLRSEVTVGTP
jgi:putative NADH-flavin reductase